MKRVARLVRVSTTHLEQADSPVHQLAYLHGEIEREGWVDSGLVYRAELTGAVIIDRPDIQRLLSDGAAGRFDAILLKSISRLGRDTLGLLMVKRMLDDLHIELIALADGYRSFRDPELIFLVHAERAQAGRQEIAKNVRAGIVQAARRGIWPAGTLPFGLRKESRFRVAPDPETAPIVRLIFALRRQGWGVTRIARHLNTEVRVKAPAWWHLRDRLGRLASAEEAGRDERVQARINKLRERLVAGGFRWTPRTVRLIVANTAYRGELQYNRTTGRRRLHGRLVREDRAPADWVTIPCTPLLEPGEWEEAQERRGAPPLPARSRSSRFLLSGRIVCGCCGAAMRGSPARPGAGRRGGDPKGYYVCRAALEAGAHPAEYVRAAALEETVLESLRGALKRVTWPQVPSPRKSGAKALTAALEDTLRDLAEARFFRREELRKGRMSEAAFTAEMALIDEREAQVRRAATGAGNPDTPCAETLAALLMLHGTVDQQKRLVEALIDRVTVRGSEAVVRIAFAADETP